MASMIDKTIAKTRGRNAESIEDCICEACLTYDNMGRLLGELLDYFGGKYDGRAMALLEDMMGDYISETV